MLWILRKKKCIFLLYHWKKNVTSKLESQKTSAETYDPSPEVRFIQATDPDIRSKPQYRKYCK